MRQEQVVRSGLRVVLTTLALLAPAVHVGPVSAAERGADVGACLQAGARLKQALVGTRGVTRLALPGSSRGLVIKADARRPLDEKACRTAIREYGQAYDAGDSVVISDVRVSRNEIAVWFGPGGYDEKSMNAPDPRMAEGRPWGLPADLQEKGGDPTTCRQFTEEEYRRYQEALRQAQHQAEDARQETALQKRMALARISGARIRLVFRNDIPLDRIAEGPVREMLADCLQLRD